MVSRRRSAPAVIGLLGVTLLLVGHAGAQPEPPPGSQAPPVPTVPLPTPDAPRTGPGPTTPSDLPSPPSPFPTVPPQANQMNQAIPPLSQPTSMPPGSQRFHFKIDPKTPVKDLLPVAPKAAPISGPVLSDDIAKIPEVSFQEPHGKVTPNDAKQVEKVAHQLAKIGHANAKKTDAFMAALLENRSDLAGLPFTMGDDCRTSGERTKQFTQAVALVRQALGGNIAVARAFNFNTTAPAGLPQAPVAVTSNFLTQAQAGGGGPFWTQYALLCEQEDAARSRTDKVLAEHVTLARMAALTQMLAPEPAELRLGLVKYLTGVPHVESSKALARMAIFSAEDEIRSAAIDALKVRKEKDYTEVLVKGLRYPWPAVAKRAADAIAKLERKDLVTELVAVLDDADPRMPTAKGTGTEKVSVVREMVKINHHRNCMMCHAPGSHETGTGNALTAEVPVPGQPLPSPSEGYRQSSPDLMIRLDVTYLRQDFSAMLPVAEAHPWPEAQRFDFFVRERKLTDDEAATYRAKLTPTEAGVLSPYHRAALAALRDITGKDTAPTAEAWRKLLNISAKTD